MIRQCQGLSFEPFRAVMAPGTARQLHLRRRLMDPSSFGGRQLALKMGYHIKARQPQGITFEPFGAVSLSTASLNTFEGSIIYWDS